MSTFLILHKTSLDFKKSSEKVNVRKIQFTFLETKLEKSKFENYRKFFTRIIFVNVLRIQILNKLDIQVA